VKEVESLANQELRTPRPKIRHWQFLVSPQHFELKKTVYNRTDNHQYSMKIRTILNMVKKAKSLPLKSILSVIAPIAQKLVGEELLEQQIASLNTAKTALKQTVTILKVIIGILSVSLLIFIVYLIYNVLI
jgi:hypothetical protein